MKSAPKLLVIASALLSQSGMADPDLGSKIIDDVRSKLPERHEKVKVEEFMTTDNRKNLCRADENLFSLIQYQVLTPFSNSIEKGEWNSLLTNFSNDAKVDLLEPSHLSLTSQIDDFKIYRYGKKQIEQNKKPSDLITFLKSYANLESADLEVSDYFIDHSWRNKSQKYNRLNTFMTLNLRGKNAKGMNISHKLSLLADIQEENSGWKIKGLHLNEAEHIVLNRTPAFKDISQKSGLTEIPVFLRREAMRRGGYTATVTDFNNDKIPDLFFGAGGNSQALTGSKNKDGKIVFNKPAHTKIPEGTFVKSSVFADFDNDGDQDAILVRFVVDNMKDDELMFYRNNGKGEYTYEPLLKKAVMEKNYAMPAAVADFNKDGLLDLYVGYPGKKDFTSFVRPDQDESKPFSPQGLFYNNGKGFSNVTAAVLPTTKGYLFPHSALAFDYDHNQTTDLVVIDDRDNISPLYHNNGKSFDQVATKIGIKNAGHGMSVATGDYNNDGLIDLAITNAVTLAETRLQQSCERNWDVAFQNESSKGLRLFKNEGAGKFSEVTDKAGFGWPGAATGGLIFVDYDNDGYDDLYVVNGLWSGNKKGNELDSLWATASVQNNILPVSLKYESHETQSTIMNILINYEGDAHSGGSRMKGNHPSLAGFQKNRLYKNNGNGSFTEVAFHEGIDSQADGYAVVNLDLNNDGKQELLLRNADPGVSANAFAPVQLFENNLINKNKSMTISLKGTESNKDAIGTEITASFNGKKVVRQLVANNGPQQYERIIHFGLGKNKTADLTIRWPNGKVEIKKSVTPGFHEFIEPQSPKNISYKSR